VESAQVDLNSVFMEFLFVYVIGVQLCIARPFGECTADVVLAFTSIIDPLQNDGSNAQLDAYLFGELRHILFHSIRLCLTT